jgi:hypothetical protein
MTDSPSLAVLQNAFEISAKKFGNLIYSNLNGNTLSITNIFETTWDNVELSTNTSLIKSDAIVIENFIPSVTETNTSYQTPIVIDGAGYYMNELTLENLNKSRRCSEDYYKLAPANEFDTLSASWGKINSGYDTTGKLKVISVKFVDTSY